MRAAIRPAAWARNSPFRPHFVFLAVGHDLDWPELSVGHKLVRTVRDGVLAAQLFLYVSKCRDTSSSLTGKNARPPVASASAFRLSSPLVWLPISDVLMVKIMTSARCAISMASWRNTRLWLSSPSETRIMARRTAPAGRLFHQLVAAGIIDRVPQRRSAAGIDRFYAGPQFVHITGKILRHVPGFVKRQHKGAV